jgi:hypothetical protein
LTFEWVIHSLLISLAAVDEIIERLTLLKLRDGDLNQYDADMVRIGQSDKMRDAVSTQLSLDAQVDAFLNMTPGTVPPCSLNQTSIFSLSLAPGFQ